MGEPLLNYDNVIRVIGILTESNGLHVPNRKITLSTAGLVPQIADLGRDSGVDMLLMTRGSGKPDYIERVLEVMEGVEKPIAIVTTPIMRMI